MGLIYNSKTFKNIINYDLIVIGGGHAGCEAAAIACKKGLKTLLITGSLKTIAELPCNPSIGGPAKGVIIREIDALGGIQALVSDKSMLQIKVLNSSKGPAVQALRAQLDNRVYPKMMLKQLKKIAALDILEAYVYELLIKNQECYGVLIDDKSKTPILSKAVVLSTGTYLNSLILRGEQKEKKGPNNAKTTTSISEQLKKLEFELIRLKTGTPPRILKDSIDYSKTTLQDGSLEKLTFQYFPNTKDYLQSSVACYLTKTNIITHNIIRENLGKSAMYGGYIEGKGPRYCPSIEDKIVRFNTKDSHQVFLEPESLTSDLIYVQGVSTSMPIDIQEAIIKSIRGLENAIIKKYAYAIEYDAINPIQLKNTLETKKIANLYTCGQINGTSGYEEAACQGLVAGINASNKILGLPIFTLARDQAYIGVLIDDLITKGCEEPYRLLTSRAEFRLLLRSDNADLRLIPLAIEHNLHDDKTKKKFLVYKKQVDHILDIFQKCDVFPNKKANDYLKKLNLGTLSEKMSLEKLLRRPEINSEHAKWFIYEFLPGVQVKDKNFSFKRAFEQAIILVKYAGYIEKEISEAAKLRRLEDKDIPFNIDYNKIPNLSSESKEKLLKIRPQTIGQASRILGVNLVDIQLVLVYIESGIWNDVQK